LGYGDADIVSITGGKPAISPEHLCMVGVRSYEPEEMAFLTKLGVRIILMEEIRQLGLTRALNEAIEIATKGTDYHYLTFDLDVMDAADAPAISIPEPNGLTRDETLKALEYLASRVEFHGIDIAEFNPKFDKDGQTFTLIADALAVLAKRHVGLHVV
jgi:arginase family enzyme